MATPTSPDPRASDCLGVADALGRVRRGDLGDDVVDALSDLDRADVRTVEAEWATLPLDTREALLRRCLERADEDVTREFGRLLRVALSDDVPAVRQLAVIGLWEDTRADLLPLLVGVADEDPDRDVRAEALATLGGLLDTHGPEAYADEDVDRLRDLLLDVGGDEGDASVVRRAAVAAVGGLGDDEEAAAVIASAATEDDPALVSAAIVAMGTTRDGRWRRQVEEALGSDDPDVRSAALRAVGLIGLPDAVEQVVEAAGDEDDEVRRAAIAALGALGGPPAVRALRTLRQDPRMDDLDTIDAALDEATVGSDSVRGL